MSRPSRMQTDRRHSSYRNPLGGRATWKALVACLFCAAMVALTASPAYAVRDHSEVVEEFATGCTTGVQDIAIDETAELVYMTCTTNSYPNQEYTLKRFDLSGTPVDFTFNAPYTNGNEIIEAPSEPDGRLGTYGAARVAIDNSSAHNGYIYVAGGRANGLEVFDRTGKHITPIKQQPSRSGICFLVRADVAIDKNGYIYAREDCGGAIVEKFSPNFVPVARLYYYGDDSGVFGDPDLSIDTTGAAWLTEDLYAGTKKLRRFEADQFSSNVDVRRSSPTAVKEFVRAFPSPLFPDPVLQAPSSGFAHIEVGPENDLVYINRVSSIETYSSGDAEEQPHPVAPAFGNPVLTGSFALAATAYEHIFASKTGGIVVEFGPGEILPDIKSPSPMIDDIGHTEATLRGEIGLDGGPEVTDCKLQIGTTTAYSSPELPCNPPSFGQDEEVTVTPSGLTTGTPYHYRLKVVTANGENVGVDRTVVPAYVLKVKTLPAVVNEVNKATLKGSLDPDGMSTTYHFDYGVTPSYGLHTAEESAGSGLGVTGVESTLFSLPPGKTWHYRLVASNANGTTIGPDMTFRTVSAPEVSGVRATEVAATSATLNARVNPTGYVTEYRFEYGPTIEYGSSVPADESAEAKIGSGTIPVDIAQAVTGLQPGVTYHFRLVATNQWGTTISDDTTFDFSPPTCPNNYVRQETGSSYLPDCRAYELVSPTAAGAVTLLPSHGVTEVHHTQNPYHRNDQWVVNNGRAVSPSRFAYFSIFGSITGIDNPDSLRAYDQYVATRTNTGWVTTFPGLTASETQDTSSKECTDTMDQCSDHDVGSGFTSTGWKSTPYIFDVDGTKVGQLPTNVRVIPGGEKFEGAQRLSADFSHFVFSSVNVIFTPGGHTGDIGSAYSNDVKDRSVSLISRMPNGDPFQVEGPSGQYFYTQFPGLSADGSHVLMQTPAAGTYVGNKGPEHLYMRVDESVTYDVSRGAAVEFTGMTRDGGTVYFTTSAGLTGDDTDGNVDLYMWKEDGPNGQDELSRVSQGNAQGNGEECTPSWTTGCDVRVLTTERSNPGGAPGYVPLDPGPNVNVPGLDDQVAGNAGDVYFYSPELLDPERLGIRDQRNLYVYRNGSVHLVATLDPSTEISRIQIADDGGHSAFVTAARLSASDNKGFRMMYSYDADAGKISCASCNPNGLPPSADVEASEGGPFMSNDGRAFFATKDSLVPRDANGEIVDVYEYVGGRPQLITSGLASVDNTGKFPESLLTSGGYPKAQSIGLESVSRDGSDVFFSTFETLVEQDQNGNFLKFYDARTGGGFPGNRVKAPCAAADECHGDDSSKPAPPVMASGTQLGNSGNLAATERRHRVKRRKHHKRKGQKHGKRRKNRQRAARNKRKRQRSRGADGRLGKRRAGGNRG